MRVVTRVLQTEIQVRFYSGPDLICGKIWAIDDERRRELFDILNKCLEDFDSDDYGEDRPGARWQLKICAKGGCLRTVFGTAEPPHGRGIKGLISGIIGEENLFYDRNTAHFWGK